MGWQDVSTDLLVKADWNYKDEDEDVQGKLSENLKRNGQIQNIVIRELDTGFYEVVDGNHRLTSAQALGMEKLHVYNLGKVSVAEAMRKSVGLNETAFHTNTYRLKDVFGEMLRESSVDDLTKDLPYSEEEINNLMALENYDLDSGDNSDLDDDPNEPFDFSISVQVPRSTYERWKEWLEYCKAETGWDNESKAFEYAIVEALNGVTNKEAIKDG